MAAHASGSTLVDAISTAIPAGGPPPAGPSPGADARWAQIDVLADTFAAHLHGLETGVPGQKERTALASLTATLSSLRAAILAYRAAPGVETLGALRSTVSAFETSLGSLRTAAGVETPSPGTPPTPA